jgi:hypothetical protein
MMILLLIGSRWAGIEVPGASSVNFGTNSQSTLSAIWKSHYSFIILVGKLINDPRRSKNNSPANPSIFDGVSKLISRMLLPPPFVRCLKVALSESIGY